MTTRSSAPVPYKVAPRGTLPDPQGRYETRELQNVQTAISTTQDMTPQPATSPPPVPKDGMKRLARAPWWPAAGQTSDAWVTYDGPSGTWQLTTYANC